MLTILMLAMITQEPIKAKLDAARVVYKTVDEDLRTQILERFDAAETRAADAGDTAAVNQVGEERASFERGNPWEFKSIDAGDLQPKHDAAVRSWAAALAEASRSYTRKRMKAETQAVQKELSLLNEDSRAKAANKSFAALQPGSRWLGKRTWSDGASAARYELIVQVREGDRFRGETITNDNHQEIVGSLRDGEIQWELLNPTRPGQMHYYKGTIKDDVISLTYHGTRAPGVPVEGTAEVKLEK